MRIIGTLPQEDMATRFSRYLYLQGIENQIEAEEDGRWTVWVYSDDQLGDAQELLRRYLINPDHSEYHDAVLQAERLKNLRSEEEAQSRARWINVRDRWYAHRSRIGPVTLTLIILCVLAALLTGLGSLRESLRPLFITDYEISGEYIRWQSGLPEIMHGQVWRLITPLFIHFGVLHLLFNMLWLRDLGAMVEQRQGSLFLVVQVLLIGALSNLAQYAVSGPSFGGMSGVVYGLMGYIWIRGRYDPGSGLFLNSSTVTMMIVWFFLCLTGLMGNVANTAHAAGLVLGMTWGFFAGRLFRKNHR
jgi:rhomboid protease GlpG